MTNWTQLVLIGMVVATHLGLDLIAPSSFDNARDLHLDAVLLGMCIGQVNLIATWAALAPGRLIVRLPWSMFLAVLMWYALVLGNRFRFYSSSYSYFTLDNAVLLGGIILGAVLVAQLPLWYFGQRFGWRLLPPGAEAASVAARETQFNIRDLLLGMAAVSVLLALGRVVLPPGDRLLPRLEGEMFVVLGVAALCNLAVVMPCIWGAFVEWSLVPIWAAGWFVYCGLASILELVVLSATLGPAGADGVLLKLGLCNLCQCLSVFFSLLVIRAAGFQLVRCSNRTLA